MNQVTLGANLISDNMLLKLPRYVFRRSKGVRNHFLTAEFSRKSVTVFGLDLSGSSVPRLPISPLTEATTRCVISLTLAITLALQSAELIGDHQSRATPSEAARQTYFAINFQAFRIDR